MKAAAPLLTLLLLAVFLTIITLPLFIGLQRIGLPAPLALLMLIILLLLVAAGAVTVVARSINDFAANLPQYQMRLREQTAGWLAWAKAHGLQPNDLLAEQLDGAFVLRLTRDALAGLGGLLSQFFIVLVIVIFMLFEAMVLPGKIRAMPRMTNDTRKRLEDAVDSVRSYMGVRALMSLLTGVLVGLLLAVTGTDYAILLGVVAFLLNFVPNVGSLLAAVPGILLALIEFGPGRAIAVAVGYVIINVAVSNFIEPRVMGRSLGLSPVIVILSLVFWAWVLGPVGMVLSVPLTMTVKVFMESLDETRGMALLFSGAAAAVGAGGKRR